MKDNNACLCLVTTQAAHGLRDEGDRCCKATDIFKLTMTMPRKHSNSNDNNNDNDDNNNDDDDDNNNNDNNNKKVGT